MRLPAAGATLVPPVAPLDRPAARLFLTSATILFVELLLIRWVPANVVQVGFFNNFLLIASFLGIGVGILLGRDRVRAASPADPLLGRHRARPVSTDAPPGPVASFSTDGRPGGRAPPGRAASFSPAGPLFRGAVPFSPAGPLLFALVAAVYAAQVNVPATSGEELLYGLTEGRLGLAFAWPFALVALTAAVMAALALPLGPLLRAMPPLQAYAVDIAGSLAGIAAFAGLAALGTPPLAWFAVAALLAALQGLGVGLTAWSLATAGTLLLALYLVGLDHGRGEIWSPYHRIGVAGAELASVYVHGVPRPYGERLESVYLNGVLNQSLWRAELSRDSFYDEVYRWFPARRFERVLVVGAGAGADTAHALRAGARRVDAVEIDPAILRIGAERHPDRPYQDPRVRRHADDGRAYLRNSAERYDLVVFAGVGSLALVATSANIRLESFLFTLESFASVRDHLARDGVFVIYYLRDPLHVRRYAEMLASVFGAPPVARAYRWSGGPNYILVAGPGAASLAGDPLPAASDPGPLPTDDWPFPYLRERAPAPPYLVALGAMLLFATAAVGGAARLSGLPLARMSPHFFVLGVAFLLLETRSLVSFSLLFGTTWLVNALVFFAILASVLAAVAVNARVRFRDERALYAGLLGSLAAAYLLPPASLLFDPAGLRYVVASALAFAPIFFANLVFTYSFRDTRIADMAFASNLLGAALGGIVEWLALVTGYQALLALVAALYLLAYLLATRWRVLADRELERA